MHTYVLQAIINTANKHNIQLEVLSDEGCYANFNIVNYVISL